MDGDNLFWHFSFAETPGFDGIAIPLGNTASEREISPPLALNVASNDAAHLRHFNPVHV